MVVLSNDGSHTFYSERYGLHYHSRFGALTESAHVFIMAGLRFRAAEQQDLSILEAGFGTGLNAFLTMLEAEKRNLRVQYLGLSPLPLDPVAAAGLNYPDLLDLSHRKADFLALHAQEPGKPIAHGEHLVLEKNETSIEHFERPEAFDLIYYNALAPQAQPALWHVDVMTRMYRSLRPEGALVTYCAQGEFKRNLKKAGFTVEKLQGPPGKREMTRALKI
jgi:tRNA U34 5-methylaminomethyl-2-thiouridine-forming methyltransferase MnmC